ncbi:MAG: hypothetical protein ACMG6S_04540 [Byssovorax sp.]
MVAVKEFDVMPLLDPSSKLWESRSMSPALPYTDGNLVPAMLSHAVCPFQARTGLELAPPFRIVAMMAQAGWLPGKSIVSFSYCVPSTRRSSVVAFFQYITWFRSFSRPAQSKSPAELSKAHLATGPCQPPLRHGLRRSMSLMSSVPPQKLVSSVRWRKSTSRSPAAVPLGTRIEGVPFCAVPVVAPMNTGSPASASSVWETLSSMSFANAPSVSGMQPSRRAEAAMAPSQTDDRWVSAAVAIDCLL